MTLRVQRRIAVTDKAGRVLGFVEQVTVPGIWLWQACNAAGNPILNRCGVPLLFTDRAAAEDRVRLQPRRRNMPAP